jgi:trimeric autotransporter adhesin
VRHQALPQYDQGPVDPAMKLGTMTLLTVPTAAQQKAITQLLAQQQDRKSPNYHKWITAEQYADRFGLSQNDIAADHGLAESAGLHHDSAGARAQLGFLYRHRGPGRERVRHGNPPIQREGRVALRQRHAPKIPAALSGIVAACAGWTISIPGRWA